MKTNKIGILGDMHLRETLSYSDYISDGRVNEKKEILDFIIESFKDCDHVVFLGDFFNSQNNLSEVNRQAVEFLEKFGKKEIYIISGNHSKKGDGSTAIDFLREVKGKNWHIFTKPKYLEQMGNLKAGFLPYMQNNELEVQTSEEATEQLIKGIEEGDILFTHHAISGTTFNGLKTELLKEVVLPKEKLEEKYKLICGGHIHQPQHVGNTLIAGSVFTNTVNEIEKFIYKINEDLTIEKIKLPCREIHKKENPTLEQLAKLPKNSIVKIILTDKKIDVEEMKVAASEFDAHLIIEDYPNSRKKAHIEEGAMDFSIEALLKLYASEKKIDYQKLLKGLELIHD